MTIDKGGLLAEYKSGYTNNRFQRVPSGGGRIVSGGGRAPVVSGMRRNPETEIDPLPPDLRDRYRIYMQERLPWFGRPPRPPALGSPRASD